MRYLILLLMLSSSLAIAAGTRVETFQVRHQPAAALVETLRPLVGESGSVSAFRDKLIVQSDNAGLASVRDALAALDHPPRRLLIEVRQSNALAAGSSGVTYGVEGDGFSVGSPPRGSQAGIGFGSAHTHARGDVSQRVRAVEGRPALIHAGVDEPVYEAFTERYPGGVSQGFQVRYRRTGDGFYALPRVYGDRVTVEIRQQHSRATGDSRFDTQAATTVLEGALGEWLTVAATHDSDRDGQDAVGRHWQTRSARDRLVQLRVLPVD
jgi:hypothetical protein